MKKLLFIGGTGFLGKSFFDYLNKSQSFRKALSEIIVLSKKKKKIFSKVKISYINRNIVDLKSIPVTDYIIYAINSKNNKENIKGVLNFKKLLNYKHKNTKILFTSSGAVYGKIIKRKKIKETDLVSIKNVHNYKNYKKEYSISKIRMEKVFRLLSKKGYNVSIARLFSFIGERILDNKDFALTNLIKQALSKKNKIIKLSDTKDVYRGYMDARDLIEWLFKILINSNKKFDIFNVGSDESTTIENLAKLIGKKFNKTVIKQKRKNINEIDYYVPSTIKAKKKLNLKINHGLKNSLMDLLTHINKKRDYH